MFLQAQSQPVDENQSGAIHQRLQALSTEHDQMVRSARTPTNRPASGIMLPVST